MKDPKTQQLHNKLNQAKQDPMNRQAKFPVGSNVPKTPFNHGVTSSASQRQPQLQPKK